MRNLQSSIQGRLVCTLQLDRALHRRGVSGEAGLNTLHVFTATAGKQSDTLAGTSERVAVKRHSAPCSPAGSLCRDGAFVSGADAVTPHKTTSAAQ